MKLFYLIAVFVDLGGCIRIPADTIDINGHLLESAGGVWSYNHFQKVITLAE